MVFEKIKRVLIANRGEIAVRIIRCCQEHGLTSIAVYSPEDRDSSHVSQADESVLLSGVGSAPYIDIEQMANVAITKKADVVLPGYGFLSENSQFAKEIANAGIIFAGPDSSSIEMFGLKHVARELAEKSSVPVLMGSPLVNSSKNALEEANHIGFPVMIKSTAGGGGMGLKVCWNETELETAFDEVTSRGKTLFKNAGAFLEKFVQYGRHIEVQVFGNGQGDVITFGERECSIQRRHQKVIEECPSPFVADNQTLRQKLCRDAINLASSARYRSAGTVEFLLDDSTGEFYFLEMNTRLQVEHGITELVYKVDLVYMMLLQAEYEARGELGIPSEELSGFQGNGVPSGHAIEARLYAENPAKNFKPSPGILHYVDFYEKAEAGYKTRVDHWVSTGSKISPYFDPLLSKFMLWSTDRAKALVGLSDVLQKSSVCGPATNKEYLIAILNSQEFVIGRTLTTFLASAFSFSPQMVEFISGGSYTTIQDRPGRVGYNGGVPLGGAADPLHFQLANLVVGNDKNVEALEISVKGPKLKFHCSATVCLAGGDFDFKVNGQKVSMFASLAIPKGSIVTIGAAIGTGARAYLAVRGGFPEVAQYLGSKSCTPALGLGGHQGRILMQGDCLSLSYSPEFDHLGVNFRLSTHSIPPKLASEEDTWIIHTLSGPHDTHDICSQEKLEKFYNTTYFVNINSNRGCIKLDGQADLFSRENGGDGGSHPSNILEYPYPLCGISVIGGGLALFGVDGGTLSGFACIAVPLLCDQWKHGQAQIGAKIQFKAVTYEQALVLNKRADDFIQDLERAFRTNAPFPEYPKPLTDDNVSHSNFRSLLYRRETNKDLPQLNVRQAGESMLLLDFGIRNFDLMNCGRQRILEEKLDPSHNEELIRVESCSGAIGMIFDINKTSRYKLLNKVLKIEQAIAPPHELKIKSTLYKLPCTFEHSALNHCLERYIHSQRPYAAYLPNNAEYVMKANNIDTVESFKKMIIGQRQVVTAVSFFCGNTVSVNLDPRTRFKTGKYNPPRTFTPKGAIGSGSVGQSIYSIDCPGGFMVWAMTLPDLCWNTFSRLKTLKPDKPWFFKNFDQIEYYEVDEAELTQLNNSLLSGNLRLFTEEVELDFGQYIEFLKDTEEEIQIVNHQKTNSTLKLAEEDASLFVRWENQLKEAASRNKSDEGIFEVQDPRTILVKGGMAANVFKINTKAGDIIGYDCDIIVLEAMKMEIHISASSQSEDSDDELEDVKLNMRNMKYKVLNISVAEGDVVGPSDVLAFIIPV